MNCFFQRISIVDPNVILNIDSIVSVFGNIRHRRNNRWRGFFPYAV